jgi:uncharacterized repeat protein (TIGR01451 family)
MRFPYGRAALAAALILAGASTGALAADSRTAADVTISVSESISASDAPAAFPPVSLSLSEAVAESESISVLAQNVADLSITKTDSPDPVQPGGTITYTITVHNGGPMAAPNAVASDSVPAQTTLTGGDPPPSGWICSVTTSNVTCTNPSFASGATAIFRFTVLLSAGASGTISNTASVSSDAFDSNSANDSATAQTTVGSPTAVTLRSFTAAPSAAGVLLRWRTGAEAKLLGFNAYRQAGGKRLRLNRDLIRVRAAAAGAAYSYVDRHAPRAQTLVYWLQAVAKDGTRTFLGPATARARKEKR